MRKNKKNCFLTISALIFLFSINENTVQASNYTPTLGANSIFTLNANDSDAVNTNTISIPKYDINEGIIGVINYELNINKTEYGKGNASKQYSIKILDDYNIDYTAKYSTSNLGVHQYIKQKDYSNIDYSGDFVDLNKPIVWGAYAFGGAITNLMGKTGDISGIFIENSTTSDKKQAWGGAIIARGETGAITADFIENYAYSSVTEATGGAISVAQYNVESIVGDFIGNYARGELTSGAYGGAIYIVNQAVVNEVIGNFIANSSRSETAGAYGGAVDVYRNGYIETLKGDFIGNYANGYREAAGGAIELVGTVDSITGDFIGNYAKSSNGTTRGGAIINQNLKSGSLVGSFINNYTESVGNSQGGAMAIYAGFETINGDFYANHSISTNSSAFGGAIFANGEIDKLEGDFYLNYVKADNGNAMGGAIYSEDSTIDTISSSFYGNYAKSENGIAQGGAIYTNNDLNFVADNKTMVFAENYTESNGIIDDNAVYVDNSDATLNFELQNSANLFIKDNFNGEVGYNVNIIGDNTNTLYLFNNLNNADLTLDKINLNSINNQPNTYKLNSMTLKNEIKFVADVDLSNATMDRFSANNSYSIEEGGKLNVINLNILNKPKEDITTILFAEKGLKDYVKYSGKTKIVTPVYVYDIAYKNKNDAGYFVFARGMGSSGYWI